MAPEIKPLLQMYGCLLPFEVVNRTMQQWIGEDSVAVLGKYYHAHNLRHSGATHYHHVRGWPLDIVQDFLGHAGILHTSLSQDKPCEAQRMDGGGMMGTQYTIVNISKKIDCGFGMGWEPKFREILLNNDSSLFLLFLKMVKFPDDHLKVIHESNSWDFSIAFPDYNSYADKRDELQMEFERWKADYEVEE